jgi:hypothetical protein
MRFVSSFAKLSAAMIAGPSFRACCGTSIPTRRASCFHGGSSLSFHEDGPKKVVTPDSGIEAVDETHDIGSATDVLGGGGHVVVLTIDARSVCAGCISIRLDTQRGLATMSAIV